jgi:hypothetical protein
MLLDINYKASSEKIPIETRGEDGRADETQAPGAEI